MALGNYLDSVLLDAVGIMDKKFQEKELRMPIFGAINSMLTKRGLLIPGHDEIRKAEQQQVTAKYLERSTQTVGNTRSCTPTCHFGDSGTLDLTWETYLVTVCASNKMFENNYFNAQQQLQNDIYNAFFDAYLEIECDIIAFYEANRSGWQGNRTLNTWDAVNDVMQVACADRDNYFNYIKTDMYALRYRQTLMDIHQINLRAMMAQQQAQGPCNDENLQFQYPGFVHYDTECITNGSDIFGTSYIIEEGGVALLDWIPLKNRMGEEAKSGPVWTTFADIFKSPWTWALYIIDGCEDTTAKGGMTQDYTKTYEFSLDLSFNVAPLTENALETPIQKYELINC